MQDKISGSDSLMDVVIKMAEGNPGAIRVLADLAKDPVGFIDILNLDDMGMRGPQIWVAYKDHCGGDIEKLRALLRERSPELVATVNREIPDRRDVTSGASFA